MKRNIYLTAVFMLIAVAAKSQHISVIASWGSYQPWEVPTVVSDVVYHNYGDYDWVHTKRIVSNGHLSYRVILQHGPQFLEVSMGRYGHVRRVRSLDYYPLHNHICSSSCGYHEYYYRSFTTTCNSSHHHGHNHVLYRPRPVNYIWGQYYNYPSYVKVYSKKNYKYYGNHGGHGNHPKYGKKGTKNNYSYKKQSNKEKSSFHDDRYRRPDPIVVSRKQPQRRQGTYEELKEDRRKREGERETRSGERTTRSRRVN